MQKTFVLGLGCQKSGSTWMHSYLNSHPKVDMGICKEYHFFDTLYHPNLFQFRKQTEALTKTFKMRLQHPDASMRMKFYRSPEKYYKYFHRLAKQKHIEIVGDITPSYAALSENNLKEIKTKLESYGFNVKVIYFMRDPIERIISAESMYRKNRARAGKTDTNSFEESVMKSYRSSEMEIRTQYNKTVPAIENTFQKQDIFFDFYESFYSQRSIKPITDFLNIPYIKANFGQPISDRKKDAVSDELKNRIMSHYSDVYEFTGNRFGNEYIRSIWPNYEKGVKG